MIDYIRKENRMERLDLRFEPQDYYNHHYNDLKVVLDEALQRLAGNSAVVDPFKGL